MLRVFFARSFATAPARALAGIAFTASALLGCTPAIGDHCTLSTDCSIQGTRLCDTSETAGYCTVLNCTADSCPDNASCIEFEASIAGCPYDDYRAPARTGRAMCMKGCNSDSDCRTQDGYACADPRGDPWNAVLLDADRSKKVCIVSLSTTAAVASVPDAQVCSSTRPVVPALDAAVTLDATLASDANPEATATPVEAGDGPAPEGQTDGSEAADTGPGLDASSAADAAVESGGADAGAEEEDASAEGAIDASGDATLDSVAADASSED